MHASASRASFGSAASASEAATTSEAALETLPVSVVIPTYKRPDYVLATVQSVLAQSPPPREVIVVDDGSPDDTEARVAPLVEAGQVRYVRQANAGLGAARNTGARRATCEYLYFIDDDDLLFRDALGWLAGEMAAHPEAGMAFGEAVLFSGTPPEPPVQSSESWDADRAAFMVFNQLGSAGQVLIRRSAFEEVGGFDPDRRIQGTSDWDMWLRLLERYPARGMRRPVLAYRLHDQNMTRNVAHMYDSSLRVARRGLCAFPGSERTVLRRYTYRRLREYHVPRLAEMYRHSIAERRWRLAASAVRAWLTAWAAEGFAYAELKAYLLLRLRRRGLPQDAPLTRTIEQHCGRL